MVLSPMMQIAAKLAQQFAPQIINGASNLVSSASAATNANYKYQCPSCKKIGNYGDVTNFSHLICECGYHFPCISGATRCTCGSLLFPESTTQEVVGCDQCLRSWKTKSNQKIFGDCRCHRTFEVRPNEQNYVTDCCATPLGSLNPVPYKQQEPRVPSEAERNR